MKKKLLVILFVLTCLAGNVNAQWQQSGLPTRQVNCLALSGTDIFAGCDSNVYRSVDNGANWTPVATGLPAAQGATSIAVSGTTLFAIANDGLSGTYVSVNNGGLWTSTGGGPNQMRLVIRGSVIYGVGFNGVLAASVSSPFWSTFNTGLPHNCAWAFGGSADAICVFIDDDGTCTPPAFAAYRRNSAATNWSVATGLQNYSAFPLGWAMVSSATNIFAGGQGAVYSSSDTGATWTTLNSGLPGDVVSALAINGTNILAGHLGAGIYLSINSGNTWTNVNTGLTDMDIRSIVINGANVFAGTATNGVWKRAVSDIITSVEEANNISHLAISPNPATNEIRIENSEFRINEIEILDVLGQKLFSRKPKPENLKQISIDVSNFSPGIYFVRLADDKAQVTRKVVVQR